MFIPASQGTAIVELGSQGRIRTAVHRVKACCRNRLATRLCVAVSSEWIRLCLPCRIWQTHRRYSALSTRGFFMRVHHSLDTCTSANPSLETTTLHFSIWRTGWDSNPRMLSYRRFSPPQSASLPSFPSTTSSPHQSHGPLSSFPGGLLLRPPYRYGLHAAQTGFLLTGHSGYFPAGVPGVFAFPVRRENSVRYFEQYVKKIVLYIE